MTATADRATLDRLHFFIDNEWRTPQSDSTLVALEAATEERMGNAALACAADVDAAVRAARAALDDGPWGHSSAEERAEVMLRFADALEARGDFTARLVSRENGMPIGLSQGFNAAGPVQLLRTYAKQILATELEEVRPSAVGSSIVRREPVGVVGVIVPWNYPQAIALIGLAPALAAGCTVVLKPSPETALDGYVIAEAAVEAGLPSGVLNIVVGDGAAGAALVSHPLVDKITFTGSTETGRKIGAECGRLIRRASLELGGKSAAVLLDDVDIDTFLSGVMMSTFMNNGQTCTAQARILAPRSRYEEIVDALAGWVDAQTVGDPLDPSVTIGPMVSRQHLERVLGYIELGKNSDARLVTGGKRPAGLDRGWFVEPTIFADVNSRDRIAQEEIFGPVVAVIPYSSEEEAITLANDTRYGLAGSVWTSDEERGVRVARQIRTGTIGINYYLGDFDAPFGGMKDSGLGRALGPEGLEEFFEYKSIYASAARLPA